MKFSIIISFILASTLFVISCKKADIAFGNQFVDNNLTQIVRVDSFTPSLSTVYLDSFITSAKGALVIGSYNDSYSGRVSSESYFDINPPAYSNIYAQASFDSIKIILKPNGYYYGDTTQPIHFTTYQLAELIQSKNFDVSNFYYNNQSFQKGGIIGAYNGAEAKLVNPTRRDVVELKLNDALGRSLLQTLQNPSNTIFQNSTNFINFFNGINITASNTDNTIAGFSDTVVMRLFYTNGSAFPQNLTVDFPLSNKAHQFNHTSVDRSNIPSAALRNINTVNKEIPSSLTGNMSYVQPYAGLLTKIRFNSISDVQKLPYYVKILKAELILRPVVNTFNIDSYRLPPGLRISTSNPLNQIVYDIVNIGGSSTSVIQNGNLVIDLLNTIGTQYTYDVTPYVKSLLNNPAAINNGLILSPPSPAYQNQVNRVLIGDNTNANGKAQLVIYYASVQ